MSLEPKSKAIRLYPAAGATGQEMTDYMELLDDHVRDFFIPPLSTVTSGGVSGVNYDVTGLSWSPKTNNYVYWFRCHVTNTGAFTILGSNVLDKAGNATVAGQIVTNGIYFVRWNASNYILLNSEPVNLAINGGTIGETTPGTGKFSEVQVLAPGTPAMTLPIDIELAAIGSGVTASVGSISAGAVSSPGFRGLRARGTIASPTAVQAGDTLTFIGALGYDGSAYVGSTGIIVFKALETFSGSARGTEAYIETCPIGSTTRRLHISWKNGITYIHPQDDVNEGGQVVLLGAAAYKDVFFDNFQGIFRVWVTNGTIDEIFSLGYGGMPQWKGINLLDLSTAQTLTNKDLSSHTNIMSAVSVPSLTAGSGSAYTVANLPSSLTSGRVYQILIHTANTGNCTLAPGGGSAINIKLLSGADPGANQLLNKVYDFWYNGTNLIPLNPEDISYIEADTATSLTIGLGHANSIRRMTSGSAITITLPNSIPSGWVVGPNSAGGVLRGGAGNITFSSAGTIRSPGGTVCSTPNGFVYFYLASSGVWQLGGDL